MIDIIGGSGFIGTYLGLRLRALGIDFNILDIEKPRSDKTPFKYTDVRNFESLLNSIEPGSTIINLAAVHRDDIRPISLYFDTNVDGAEKICMAAEEKLVERLIFTSSVAVYGQSLEVVSEDVLPVPSNPYGESKLQAEEVFIRWQMKDPAKRNLTIIRPTVVFGPSNRGNFYNLVNQIIRNKFLMIGSGDNKKSIAYVENLADFIVHSMKFPTGIHIYNYVDEPDLSMSKLIELIYGAIGYGKVPLLKIPYTAGYLIGFIFDIFSLMLSKKLPISRLRIKKFCSNSRFSSKLNQSGFRPETSLVDAVTKTVKFEYENYLNGKN